jgi:hypothetical protein
MSKPVSKNHSTAEVTSTGLLDDAKALAGKITTLVGEPPALTKADVQRSAKLRKGGAAMVKTIAALSDKVGLVVPSQPTATLVGKINQAESLVALHQELVTATKQVADAMFLAQSQSWAGTTVHYSVLRRLSKTDGSIAKALQPVTQFFSARSASVTDEQKAARGGARKGSAKAKANRAAKRAAQEATLGNTEASPSAASSAPPTPAGPTGASTPQAPTPAAGAAHS